MTMFEFCIDIYSRLTQEVCKIALTHKQLEMYLCILITVATDALGLKHQTISIHSADNKCIIVDQFGIKILHS